ncbi:MAG: trimethylamine monooxygenase [Octadecabacter sp.]|jgi:trimethylamine monooxygenase
MIFQNHGHKTVLTGTMGPKHYTPWQGALDDSFEFNLQN